jgi:hypothetical protein
VSVELSSVDSSGVLEIYLRHLTCYNTGFGKSVRRHR